MKFSSVELCNFNLSSSIKLLKKEGASFFERKRYRTSLIKLYRIYNFYVEVRTKLHYNRVIPLIIIC